MNARSVASLGALGAAALVAGCGPASIDGTVGGKALDTSDAIGRQWSLANTKAASIVIGGDTPDLCRDAADGVRRQDASYLELSFGRNGSLTTGDYAIGGIPVLNDSFAAATANALDSACGSILKKTAGGGKITLEKIEGTTIVGSFEVAFGADIVKGSFNARLCGAELKTDVTSCL